MYLTHTYNKKNKDYINLVNFTRLIFHLKQPERKNTSRLWLNWKVKLDKDENKSGIVGRKSQWAM